MNVDYINPFINASINVFKTFAQIESTPGRPKVSASLVQTGFVNGYIGLEGHGISGYFIINFSRHFIEQIIRNLFGSQKEISTEELFDAAGELTNMISGGAKAELSKQGFFFDVAVPRISKTAPAVTDHMKKNPVILVPFDTKVGDYTIQASILKIEEDFAAENSPKIPPPPGMISVSRFSELTGMGQVKVRRFLKIGFLKGNKVSRTQWHIPEKELEKVQVKKISKPVPASHGRIDETYVSISEFSELSRLKPSKIKAFLRSGFLKGIQDDNHVWHIKREYVEKFKKY